jgi:hypothetical protein
MGPLILQSSLIFLSYGVGSCLFLGPSGGGGGEARGLSLPSDIVVAARAGFCIPITLTNLASPWFK